MTTTERLGWAAVLALPLVALAGRCALAERDEDARNRPAIARPGAADTAMALEGGVDLPGLGHLTARLVRLHADARRQAFDAEALRRRFAIDSGEPFLLRLDLLAAAQPDESAGPLDPRGLRVVDERGVALTTPALLVGEDLDPLAALLQSPRAIAPGESASLVLFGREPGAGARVALASGAELVLAPASVLDGGTDVPIARIDARTPAAETTEPR